MKILMFTLMICSLLFADVIKLSPRLGKIITQDNDTYKIKEMKTKQVFEIKRKNILTKKIDPTKPVLFKLPYKILNPKEHYKFNSKQIRKLVNKHKQRTLKILIDFMQSAESINSPNYLDPHKYSSLFNFFQAYAQGEMDGICFFGGWPSTKALNGKCNSPWRSTVKSQLNASNMSELQQYDSSQFCNSPDHVRCNPKLFGEVKAEQDYSAIANQSDLLIKESGALCVKKIDTQTKKFVNLTKNCHELSNQLSLEAQISGDELEKMINGALQYCQVEEISLSVEIPQVLKDPCEPLLAQLVQLKTDLLAEGQENNEDNRDDTDEENSDDEDRDNDDANNDGVPDKVCLYNEAQLLNEVVPGEWGDNAPVRICEDGQCYIEVTCYYEKIPNESESSSNDLNNEVTIDSLPSLTQSEVIRNDANPTYMSFPTLLKCPCPHSVITPPTHGEDIQRVFGSLTAPLSPARDIDQEFIDQCLEQVVFESSRENNEDNTRYEFKSGSAIEN